MSGKPKPSALKALGIAGKDTLAFMLIAQGVDIAKNGDLLLGGGLIVAGGALLLIQQFV